MKIPFLPSALRTFNKLLKWVLGTSASSGAGFLFLAERIDGTAWHRSIILAFGVIAIAFVIIFIYHLITYAKDEVVDSRYRKAMSGFAEIFSEFHGFGRWIDLKMEELDGIDGDSDDDEFENGDDEAYDNLMNEIGLKFAEVNTNLCTRLGSIFKELTGKECHVSIKIIHDSEELKDLGRVENIYRCDCCKKIRDDDNYRNQEHTIVNNTSFYEVKTKFRIGEFDSLYYCCNDIVKAYKYDGYRNTSLTAKHWEEDRGTELKILRRGWPLEYTSEIVVAIAPIIPAVEKKPEMIGFICIDSKSTNVFNPKLHFDMLRGLSDGIFDLYSLLLRDRTLFKNENDEIE